MTLRWPFACPLLMLALVHSSGAADAIYRCVDSNGATVFANAPCDSASTPLTLPPLGIIGSDDGGASLNQRLRRLRAQPDPKSPAKRRGGSSKRPLGFSERVTLRKLEIRRDGLEKDIKKGALSDDYRAALQDELRDVKRQLRELKARER